MSTVTSLFRVSVRFRSTQCKSNVLAHKPKLGLGLWLGLWLGIRLESGAYTPPTRVGVTPTRVSVTPTRVSVTKIGFRFTKIGVRVMVRVRVSSPNKLGLRRYPL